MATGWKYLPYLVTCLPDESSRVIWFMCKTSLFFFPNMAQNLLVWTHFRKHRWDIVAENKFFCIVRRLTMYNSLLCEEMLKASWNWGCCLDRLENRPFKKGKKHFNINLKNFSQLCLLKEFSLMFKSSILYNHTYYSKMEECMSGGCFVVTSELFVNIVHSFLSIF